jgi:hypothetical protein
MPSIRGPRAHLARRLVVLVGALSLVGCTTLRPVRVAGVAAPQDDARETTLAVGDDLVLTLKTGDVIAMKLTAIAPDAIAGVVEQRQQSIPLSAITRTERQEASRVWMVVVALVVVALLQYGRGVAKVASP